MTQPIPAPSPGRVRIISPATHRARYRVGHGLAPATCPPGDSAEKALWRARRRVALPAAGVVLVALALPALAALPLSPSQAVAACVVVAGVLPGLALVAAHLRQRCAERASSEEVQV